MRVTGDNIINHPEYLFNDDTITHDIAILRLPQEITFTDKIRPVCLPNRSQLRNFNVGETVRLSGWGQTSDRPGISPVLQHTKHQNIMSNKECRAHFEHYISGNIICMDATPTNAGCRGDSGGPLFALIDAKDSAPAHIVQYGVTSFTGVSCEEGDPFAFSRVTAFFDFIERVTGRK
jgi:secreted trypsin-like serine protease